VPILSSDSERPLLYAAEAGKSSTT